MRPDNPRVGILLICCLGRRGLSFLSGHCVDLLLGKLWFGVTRGSRRLRISSRGLPVLWQPQRLP